MTHREKLDALKAEEVARHKTAMSGFNALLSLVDEPTGMIPEQIIKLVVGELGGQPPAPPQTPQYLIEPPLFASLSVEDAIYRIMEEGQDTYFLADKAWNTRQIYYMLESRGYPFPQGQEAGVNTVSTTLIRMTDKGILERTAKGSGRSPSMYRWIRPEKRDISTRKNSGAWDARIGITNAVVDPANVGVFGGFSMDWYDATRNGIKGGTYGTLAGLSGSSFDEFAKQKEKEKEDSEKSS